MTKNRLLYNIVFTIGFMLGVIVAHLVSVR